MRKIFASNVSYFEINQEERNMAAILFYLVNIDWPDNVSEFARWLGYGQKIDDHAEIYFEYAFVRDLWKVMDNHQRKSVIQKFLTRCFEMKPEFNDSIMDNDCRWFNERFVARKGRKVSPIKSSHRVTGV